MFCYPQAIQVAIRAEQTAPLLDFRPTAKAIFMLKDLVNSEIIFFVNRYNEYGDN